MISILIFIITKESSFHPRPFDYCIFAVGMLVNSSLRLKRWNFLILFLYGTSHVSWAKEIELYYMVRVETMRKNKNEYKMYREYGFTKIYFHTFILSYRCSFIQIIKYKLIWCNRINALHYFCIVTPERIYYKKRQRIDNKNHFLFLTSSEPTRFFLLNIKHDLRQIRQFE